MGKLELEVKILDIDKEKFIKKLKKLGYSIKEALSCTADQVYEKYGKSMFNKIKF